MPEYAPMLHVSYYAQNYAGIIRQGLDWFHWSCTELLCLVLRHVCSMYKTIIIVCRLYIQCILWLYVNTGVVCCKVGGHCDADRTGHEGNH